MLRVKNIHTYYGLSHILFDVSLAVDAGVDFPSLYADALAGRPARGPREWRVGLRRRNLAFDLRRAARVLAGPPAGVSIPWPGRRRAVFELLFERAGGMILRRDDPGPGRAHALRMLDRAVRRV